MITNNLAWAAVFVSVFSFVSLYWSFFVSKKLHINEEATDNIFTRLVLFFGILVGI